MGAQPGNAIISGLARRVLAYGLIVALVVCAQLDVEPWPLSSFRLFSLTRSGTEIKWELVRVDGRGGESAVDLSTLGSGYRQSDHYLPGLAAGRASGRAAACDAWMSASGAQRIRVYRSVYQRRRPDDAPHVAAHVLRFECTR